MTFRLTEDQYLDHQARLRRCTEALSTSTVKAEQSLKPKPPTVTDKQKMLRKLLQQIRLGQLPDPVLEYRFHDTRKWRFDACWPEQLVAAEYEGGIWTGGSHTRGKRYQGDCEKYNAAQLMGFRVYRFTYDLVKSGYAFGVLEEALT